MFIRFPQCLPAALCGAIALLISGCSMDPFAANGAVSPSVPSTSVAKKQPSPMMTKVSHTGSSSAPAAKASCGSDGFCALPIRRPNPVTP